MQRTISVAFFFLSLSLAQAGIFDEIADQALKFVPKYAPKFIKNVETGTSSGKPAFCNDLDCPQYTVVKKEKDYEVRKYVKTTWVSTSMNGISYDESIYKMFMKLFNYIQGDNVADEKIAMTAPVINRLIPGPGPACENNFTMSFFMSPKIKDPPKPKKKDVFLSTLPELTAYVSSFGGFATETDDIQKAAKLAQILKDAGVSFYEDFYYTAGYDSPFKLLNRHNEVWFIGK
ncbi:heme-binding protein 2 [Lingula anatina]|uniref:Heme-binding protein 2 n=1 Tax=Lingula anatina TaxID=7574 RepID=A0A1S3J8K1_LINAN|nr:heme-binding protein 2 [Lingula anatina]|eukprot:XP_013406732.1 heme-binding protein 2 [Lingula anatina]